MQIPVDTESNKDERTYTPLEANNGMMLVVVTEGSKHLGAYTDGMLIEMLDQLAEQYEGDSRQDTADKLRAASVLLWHLLNQEEEGEE